MLSSEYDVTVVLINPQQLWLPAHNQDSQSSSIEWGGAHQAIPQTDEPLMVDS